jgi:hypothetical protein
VLGGVQEETADDLPPIPSDVPTFETFGSFSSEVEAPATEEAQPEIISFETTQPEQSFSDPSASFADLGDDVIERSSEFQMVDFGEVSTTELDSETSAESTTEPDRVNATMRQELESVDFYISQGYTDIAVDTLDMLERQFGAHPEILARRQKLGPVQAGQLETPAVFEFGGDEEISDRQGDSIPVEASFTLGSIADEGNGPGPTSTTKQPVSAGKGLDSGLAELFEEFRAAEEEEIEDQADFETHYNMGTAYKEMDLLDEAIHEFQTAATVVKASDGTSRYLQCCNMLGHCFMRKDMVDAAIMWFKKGLAAPGHSEDEYQALRYELAAAYEHQGDLKQARNLYTEIYGIDVSYREVAEKLRELRSKSEGS